MFHCRVSAARMEYQAPPWPSNLKLWPLSPTIVGQPCTLSLLLEPSTFLASSAAFASASLASSAAFAAASRPHITYPMNPAQRLPQPSWPPSWPLPEPSQPPPWPLPEPSRPPSGPLPQPPWPLPELYWPLLHPFRRPLLQPCRRLPQP